jgi:hypothetical protein
LITKNDRVANAGRQTTGRDDTPGRADRE